MALMSNFTPNLIAVAGDWHADTAWAVQTIRQIADFGDVDLIIQAGDFGYWPASRAEFLAELEEVLTEVNIPLWWVDGNHEDFNALYSLPLDAAGRRPISDHITHLPRGHRWEWDGVTWMAFGGGISMDRERRVPGDSWFSQEAHTPEEVDFALRPGRVDVIVSHDAPYFAPTLRSNLSKSSYWPQRELDDSRASQMNLQEIVEAKAPKALYHGHHHFGYTDYVMDTRVTGLSCNGSSLSRHVSFVTPTGDRAGA
jgi:hypothetical protein